MNLVLQLPTVAVLVVTVVVCRRVHLRALRWFMAVQGAGLLGALVRLAMDNHNRGLRAGLVAAARGSEHQPSLADLMSLMRHQELVELVRGYLGTALFLGLTLAFFVALLREIQKLQAARVPAETEGPVPPCR
jgi:hypothetical protein